MKAGSERVSKQMKSRSASSGRRGHATSAMVDGRDDSALQRRLMNGIDSSAPMQRQRDRLEASFGHPLQRNTEEDEELLQGKFATLQRQGPEEEELLQGKFDPLQRQLEEEELMQGKFDPLQRQPEEEELMQGKFAQPAQRESQTDATPNKTGLPDNLKSGIESLAGMEMSDVRVHYNSTKPAQLNAHAYAQGNDIHLGPGQEKHLPHEAWHTVQQRQGRVQPTMEMAGEKINDDGSLEREADVMGAKAVQHKK